MAMVIFTDICLTAIRNMRLCGGLPPQILTIHNTANWQLYIIL
jgi:hypothetical protein